MKQHQYLEPCDWDTSFFGYKVGRINASSFSSTQELLKSIELAKEIGYRLLYLIRNHEEVDYFLDDKLNVVLADKKVTFSQPISKSQELLFFNNDKIKLYNEEFPNEKLIDLTLQSGVHSRFSIDPNFKNNEYKRLYTEWISKSVSGILAKEVWISELDEQLCGMITLSTKEQVADIGLLAVDSHFRGKSIGVDLVNIAKSRSKHWNLNKLQVITQLDNHLACKFYTKCGFSIEKIEYIYHVWI